MTSAQAWTLINSPLAILLIGSGIGYLFVKLVWEPLQASRAAREKRGVFQQEARFRLLNIRLKLKDPAWRYEFEVTGSTAEAGAGLTSSIDPTYRTWGLHGLIYAGWNRALFDACYPLIDDLLKAERASAAVAALDSLEAKLAGGEVGG